MPVELTRHGAVTVVKPTAPLTETDIPDFSAQLSEAVQRSYGRLVLDAEDVAYIDSVGLEALADAAEDLANAGRSFKVCNANETIREVLELTDLAPLFEHYEQISDAVRSFM